MKLNPQNLTSKIQKNEADSNLAIATHVLQSTKYHLVFYITVSVLDLKTIIRITCNSFWRNQMRSPVLRKEEKDSRIKSLISTNSRHVSCAGSNLAWLRGELIWGGGGKSKQKESLPIIRTGQRVAAPSTMFTTTPSQVFIPLRRIFFFEIVRWEKYERRKEILQPPKWHFLGIFRCQIMRHGWCLN